MPNHVTFVDIRYNKIIRLSANFAIISHEQKKRIETLLEKATSDVALRLLLIHYVYNCKITPENAAEMLFKSRSWAYKWLKRYK